MASCWNTGIQCTGYTGAQRRKESFQSGVREWVDTEGQEKLPKGSNSMES